MIKYFKTAFKITNENIILATPLVLFLFLLSIYMGIAKNAQETIPSAVLLLSTILFMLSAFFAGWLFMVRRAVELDKKEFILDEDKAKASFSLIKEFPIGVGEYFLPFIGGFILYLSLFAFVLFVAHQAGMHFIGKVNLNLAELKIALGSPVAMKSLVSSLTTEQLQKLNAWNMLFISTVSAFSFITIFWPAQIVFKTKNPFSAFFHALVFTFKNFLPAIILFVYISFINFAVSLLNALATVNPLIYFVSLLMYFYFLVYVVVLIFLYYDRENDKQLKETHQEIQNHSDSGTDSIGQDETGDNESERD